VTQDRFRVLVSGVLIVGVITSAVLMAVGFAASLVVGWRGSLVGLPATTLSASDFAAVGSGLRELRPIAIAQAGLLVLIATPVARVMTSVVAFVLERDRLYAAITVVVLAILLVSLFGVGLVDQ
jgi:uncharacterized membrane protein